ncbi:hypothetical protein CBS147346_1230 [Aspergillus niger]|nr:hypothetical protein CBS147346_1230 [Aspergillus niger]
MKLEKEQTRPSHFEDIPENEIIELASYHRRDFDLAVIRINPHDHEHVRSSISQPLESLSTSTGLGKLELLHLELIHEVCLYLDIESLFRFRQVSRHAQQYVSTSRFYRETTTHALDALCVLLRTKVANRFTLAELFTALCTRDCTLCSSSLEASSSSRLSSAAAFHVSQRDACPGSYLTLTRSGTFHQSLRQSHLA